MSELEHEYAKRLAPALNIALGLESPWAYVAPEEERTTWFAEITDGDIKVTIGRCDKGRVEIWGHADGVNQFIPYGETLPRMTVSMTRPIEQIAKEVHRRLIPDHRRIMTEARRQKEKFDKSERERHTAGYAIARILESNYNEQTGYIGAYNEPHRAHVHVQQGSAVKWEVHLSHDHSMRLAEFLKELEEEWRQSQ